MSRILIVEDHEKIRVNMMLQLQEQGYQVTGLASAPEALTLLRDKARPDLMLLDIRLGNYSGVDLIRQLNESGTLPPTIVVSGEATISETVEALKLGVYDFIEKPAGRQRLLRSVRNCLEHHDLKDRVDVLKQQLENKDVMLGESNPMRVLREQIEKVAPTDGRVLIRGESGTGKELVANMIHRLSCRAAGPFIKVNCAAIPANLIEDELFGHVRGAFTDARKDRKGRFELADGGTIFLDDIDDMPLATQVKLLRVLQERVVERLGAENSREVDIRVLAATKVSLRQLAREGKFREDLYYRINVVPVELPPLRERDGDIPGLVRFLIERHGGGRNYDVSPATMRALERYPWPGNVRELENAVQRAIALAGPGRELAADEMLPRDKRWRGATEVQDDVRPLREVLRELEVSHIQFALEKTGGHRSQTADLLGISRKVLWEKMRDFHILPPGEEPAPGKD